MMVKNNLHLFNKEEQAARVGSTEKPVVGSQTAMGGTFENESL